MIFDQFESFSLTVLLREMKYDKKTSQLIKRFEFSTASYAFIIHHQVRQYHQIERLKLIKFLIRIDDL